MKRGLVYNDVVHHCTVYTCKVDTTVHVYSGRQIMAEHVFLCIAYSTAPSASRASCDAVQSSLLTIIQYTSVRAVQMTKMTSFTTTEKLIEVGHIPGPQCRCSECARLKSVEEDWILKLGTFFGRHLNTRNEIKSKARVNAQW